ncbi:hypothetical protein HELRODRAFT_162187 [Helobdella robusta]|uniref:C2H2-type domain-containing protein n=1 Tax=Helobdella robusta TaxID=6412 RepID=T1ESC2_HELRO|nr:hypothetical protein HELRODRAFT_162187 [Helobdella robusta]ESN98736.1 hypothetical protein HELRODRAFT_162187 [Helobdella robusta]
MKKLDFCREQVTLMLKDCVKMCVNFIPFNSSLSFEGFFVITSDKSDVLVIKIDENKMKNEGNPFVNDHSNTSSRIFNAPANYENNFQIGGKRPRMSNVNKKNINTSKRNFNVAGNKRGGHIKPRLKTNVVRQQQRFNNCLTYPSTANNNFSNALVPARFFSSGPRHAAGGRGLPTLEPINNKTSNNMIAPTQTQNARQMLSICYSGTTTNNNCNDNNGGGDMTEDRDQIFKDIISVALNKLSTTDENTTTTHSAVKYQLALTNKIYSAPSYSSACDLKAGPLVRSHSTQLTTAMQPFQQSQQQIQQQLLPQQNVSDKQLYQNVLTVFKQSTAGTSEVPQQHKQQASQQNYSTLYQTLLTPSKQQSQLHQQLQTQQIQQKQCAINTPSKEKITQTKLQQLQRTPQQQTPQQHALQLTPYKQQINSLTPCKEQFQQQQTTPCKQQVHQQQTQQHMLTPYKQYIDLTQNKQIQKQQHQQPHPQQNANMSNKPQQNIFVENNLQNQQQNMLTPYKQHISSNPVEAQMHHQQQTQQQQLTPHKQQNFLATTNHHQQLQLQQQNRLPNLLQQLLQDSPAITKISEISSIIQESTLNSNSLHQTQQQHQQLQQHSWSQNQLQQAPIEQCQVPATSKQILQQKSPSNANSVKFNEHKKGLKITPVVNPIRPTVQTHLQYSSIYFQQCPQQLQQNPQVQQHVQTLQHQPVHQSAHQQHQFHDTILNLRSAFSPQQTTSTFSMNDFTGPTGIVSKQLQLQQPQQQQQLQHQQSQNPQLQLQKSLQQQLQQQQLQQQYKPLQGQQTQQQQHHQQHLQHQLQQCLEQQQQSNLKTSCKASNDIDKLQRTTSEKTYNNLFTNFYSQRDINNNTNNSTRKSCSFQTEYTITSSDNFYSMHPSGNPQHQQQLHQQRQHSEQQAIEVAVGNQNLTSAMKHANPEASPKQVVNSDACQMKKNINFYTNDDINYNNINSIKSSNHQDSTNVTNNNNNNNEAEMSIPTADIGTSKCDLEDDYNDKKRSCNKSNVDNLDKKCSSNSSKVPTLKLKYNGKDSAFVIDSQAPNHHSSKMTFGSDNKLDLKNFSTKNGDDDLETLALSQVLKAVEGLEKDSKISPKGNDKSSRNGASECGANNNYEMCFSEEAYGIMNVSCNETVVTKSMSGQSIQSEDTYSNEIPGSNGANHSASGSTISNELEFSSLFDFPATSTAVTSTNKSYTTSSSATTISNASNTTEVTNGTGFGSCSRNKYDVDVVEESINNNINLGASYNCCTDANDDINIKSFADVEDRSNPSLQSDIDFYGCPPISNNTEIAFFQCKRCSIYLNDEVSLAEHYSMNHTDSSMNADVLKYFNSNKFKPQTNTKPSTFYTMIDSIEDEDEDEEEEVQSASCPFQGCKRTFITVRSLTSHYTKTHKLQLTSKQLSRVRTKMGFLYACNLCDQVFKKERLLKEHSFKKHKISN